MFEKIAFGAVETLILLFWVILAFIIIWGALWVHAYKKARSTSA